MVATLSVFVQAWALRFFVGGDTTSYLDMGDAYLRGDWKMAINAYWSPLYSLLIVIPRRLLSIPMYWEPMVIQLVDLLIFLSVLASFEYFMSVLVRHRPSSAPGVNLAPLPAWALRSIGYGLFLYSTSIWLPFEFGLPDLLVMGIVFLIFACLIKLRFENGKRIVSCGLGLLLGIGYLTKAAMFPMAFIFLATALLVAGRSKRAAVGALLASLVFLIVSAPLIYALSKAKDRLTFGDSAKINYAMHVNDLPKFIHWQGAETGSGIPVHPTRKILDVPPVYEFATPVRGTYPPWNDPSYWWEGVIIRFSTRQQVMVLASNLRLYVEMMTEQAEFPTALLSLCFFAASFWSCARGLGRQWYLWIPCATAMLMYALIHVESRYVEGYWIVLWIGLFSRLALPDFEASRKFIRCVTLAVVILVGVRVLSATESGLHRFIQVNNARGSYLSWEVAEKLRQMGIQPGDHVASIGNSYDNYWARLAGVSIVAEIPAEGTEIFWESSPSVKDRVYEAIVKTGAKAIVSDSVPPGVSPTGWVRIDRENSASQSGTFFVYLLASYSRAAAINRCRNSGCARAHTFVGS